VQYSTAIVTGASRGLGLAVAQALRARGLNVVAAARTRPPDDALEWFEADVSDAAQIRSLVERAHERFGVVDVLVNNAGIGWQKPFEEESADDLRRVVDLNLTGAMLCAREVLPGMLGSGRGLIVNIGSDLSRRYNPGMAAYTATKFGLLGFSGSLMREVKDRGVNVVTLLPGVIDTGFGDFAAEGSRNSYEGMQPGELADIVASLLDAPEHLLVHELVVHPRGQQGI